MAGRKGRYPEAKPRLAPPPYTSDNGQEKPSRMAEPTPIFDIVVAGAGASGLAFAAAVKQAMGAGVSVAVVDPAPSPDADAKPMRAVAIAEGPRRLLESVGAWQTMEPKTQAILAMAIMDGDVGDAVRLATQFRGARTAAARPHGVQRRCRGHPRGAVR